MLIVERSGLAVLEAIGVHPILLQTFTLQLGGFTLLIIFMAIGGYVGWTRGLRAILTVALMTIIAYLATVRAGNQLVDIINRFWTNGPRLAAFAVGRDPATVAPLDPLITFEVPLFFRLVLFFVLIIIGFAFNKKSQWYGPRKEQYSPLLGLATGALTALLWTDALASFARESGLLDGFGAFSQILGIIPDVSVFTIPLITVFFIMLGFIILYNFPKVWAPPK